MPELLKPDFETVFEVYYDRVYKYAYTILLNRENAEDVVEETFLAAYVAYPGYDPARSSLATWLTRIAINTCRDLYRSEWFQHMDRRVTPEDLPECGAPFSSREESLIVEVMRLPRRLREVTLLYYYHGMDERDIAEALGISRSAVSDRLSRARRKLKGMIEGRDEA